MIVDSSAIVAILRNETEAVRFAHALEAASARRMSAGNYLETAIVLDSDHDPILSRRLDELLRTATIEVAPVTLEQARLAREAYRNFGRGSGHPAKLNYGDCFAYALAVATGEPVLAKGEEFRKAGLKLVR